MLASLFHVDHHEDSDLATTSIENAKYRDFCLYNASIEPSPCCLGSFSDADKYHWLRSVACDALNQPPN